MPSLSFKRPVKIVRCLPVSFPGWLATLALAGLLVMTSCTTSSSERNIEDHIRGYLYGNQPTTGQQFVEWAEVELVRYSSEQVWVALHNEGEYQAQVGHPNTVGVLSFAARDWSQEHGLPYDATKWVAMQQEAKANMRSTPGQLNLWPRP